jgi:hypothetical protein
MGPQRGDMNKNMFKKWWVCQIQPIGGIKYNQIHYYLIDWFEIGGIKYKKFTIRNQSIIQKYFSSPMGPQKGKMKKKNVVKKVGF